MLRIELIPDLSHCIETVAKREYRKAIAKLLVVPKENNELEQRIELLRTFLETMDFRKLRQESEKYLEEGRTVKFIFYLENGAPKYEMTVT